MTGGSGPPTGIRELRGRLLLESFVLLAVMLVASIFLARSILLLRLDTRIGVRLARDIDELHVFATNRRCPLHLDTSFVRWPPSAMKLSPTDEVAMSGL